MVPPLPWPAVAFPSLPDVVVDVSKTRVELGRLLFFDPILSVDRETACATCHLAQWGMADALPQAIGHGGGLLSGPSRVGSNTLRRNSLSLYNVAFRSPLLWDGRAATLEEQVLIPLLTENEMNRDPDELATDVGGIPEYAALFADAFPENPEVTVENLASALATYQRTFVSKDSAYDAYVAGSSGALSEELVEGMFRFAEMGCDGCHSPPLFESNNFAHRGVADVEGVVDHGLEEVTGRSEDRGRFRTPTLRNVNNTQPYFHNGSVLKLSDAVRHELEQSELPFTEEDVRLIAEFIGKALRDDRNQAAFPAEVPSGLPLPVDPFGGR
ncbi:MAG: cytochrome-c peroxidase [Deltaproteobacteria bacterium]|nr:cytochrome-c peroxidase [Deltaproteobacteria bacterium]